MCGDKENPIQYVGTELKVALTIECDGFSMDTDNWTAKVNGNWSEVNKVYKKENSSWVEQSDNSALILITYIYIMNEADREFYIKGCVGVVILSVLAVMVILLSV